MPNRNPTVVYPPGNPRRSPRVVLLHGNNNPTTPKPKSSTQSKSQTVRVMKSSKFNDESARFSKKNDVKASEFGSREMGCEGKRKKISGVIDEGVVVEGGGKRKRKCDGGEIVEELRKVEVGDGVKGKRKCSGGDKTVEELRKKEVEGGVKGKRKRGGVVAEGWSKEQENVSKLVPGKSKQDCFDRVGDIFSVLEPNIDFSSNAILPTQELCTPKQQKENQGFVQIYNEISSSSSIHKTSLSRFSGSSGVQDLASPPVLKNKVQHEKYVNQLRFRDLRRRAASTRAKKSLAGEGKCIQKTDVVLTRTMTMTLELKVSIGSSRAN